MRWSLTKLAIYIHSSWLTKKQIVTMQVFDCKNISLVVAGLIFDNHTFIWYLQIVIKID